MPLVIPRWTAHSVRDWEELLVNTADEVIDKVATARIQIEEATPARVSLGRSNGGTQLNEATAALLNYMLVIGITGIRVENVDDVWRRIAIHQALFGNYLIDVNKMPLFLTKSDVERHIGIETEVEQRTFEEFVRGVQARPLEKDEAQLPSFVANGNRTLLHACGIGRAVTTGQSA